MAIMYTDAVEGRYFEKRLQASLDMASRAVDPGALRAHCGLVSCYRAKLVSLSRVDSLPTRPILSLGAFRHKRSASVMAIEPLVFAGISGGVS